LSASAIGTRRLENAAKMGIFEKVPVPDVLGGRCLGRALVELLTGIISVFLDNPTRIS
jgi:hypothetical protein